VDSREPSSFPQAALPEGDVESIKQRQRLEAMGRLLAGVVHDFNNLLTMILVHSELAMKRTSSTDGVRANLEEIQRAATTGSSLTSQLLAFSRGRQEPSETVDFNECVRRLIQMLQRALGETIELRLDLQPDAGAIRSKAGQIEQVLLNLILNARDAMPRGGLISVKTSSASVPESQSLSLGTMAPGHYAVLSVSDNGVGMDVETRNRLFEPFFSTKPHGTGTGLGLSTVRDIVTQLGGAISVESEEGRGASFSIHLPQTAHSPVATPEPLEPPEKKENQGTILLVEDEDSVRKFLAMLLNGHGYTVVQARTGQEALDVFATHAGAIHLLLTDLIMPGGMNGREVAASLRERQPGLPVLFMSGYTQELLVRQGAIYPGMPLIQKPVRPKALAESVRRAMDQHSVTSA
jgi:two-component system, cell cycle sensor histidine kinase and response regulator CckA